MITSLITFYSIFSALLWLCTLNTVCHCV